MQYLGTCQIRIQASGKYHEDYPDANIALFATPEEIRGSVMSVIEKCVGNNDPKSNNKAGFTTLDLANVIKWITTPRTVFPEDLDLRADLTFFTAMLWNYTPDSPDIEPGSHDEETAYVIAHELDKAADAAPWGSSLRENLLARAKYVHGSEWAINDHGGPASGIAWWSGPVDAGLWSSQNSSVPGACANQTLLMLPQASRCSTPSSGAANSA